MIQPILKPKDMPRVRASIVVKVYPGGRECCNMGLRAGLAEYRWRTLEALERQGGRCCLQDYAPMCPGYLSEDDATMDHEHGRGHGGGKRDDRLEVPDPDNPGKMKWQNGAAHLCCNVWKGSIYIDYNRSFQK